MNRSIVSVLRRAGERLQAANVADPARDARLILRHVLGVDGAGLAERLPGMLTEAETQGYNTLIERRAAREPLSHITGTREFWGHAFRVNRNVLDPRPETETLIAEALHRGPFRKVLDLGTGSGCILLTLMKEWPTATGMGVDASAQALEVAIENAGHLDALNRCEFLLSDWYSEVTGMFDLIVSNPPYIAEDEIGSLAPEVRLYEPPLALTPGGDGLSAYEVIAGKAQRHLSPTGTLMVEIGPTQSHQVSAIFANAGLIVQAVIPDLDQRPRVIVAHP